MNAQSVVIGDKLTTVWSNGAIEQPKIIFLHGFRGNHHGLELVAQSFPDYHVLIPDLPGYGASAQLSTLHTFQAYTTWLHQLYTTMVLEPCHLMGHSFGASLGLVFAAQYPQHIKKLALISPVIAADTLETKLGQAYYQTAQYLPSTLRTLWVKSRLIDFLSNLLLLKSPSWSRRWELIMSGQQTTPTLDAQVIIENFLSFYDTDFIQLAQKITAPTLLVTGTRDRVSPVVNLQSLHQLMPTSQLKIIAGIGHIAQLEEPQLLGNVLHQYFSLS